MTKRYDCAFLGSIPQPREPVVAGSLPATFWFAATTEPTGISASCRDEQAGSLCFPEPRNLFAPLDFLRGLRIKNGVEILCIDRSFGICRQFSLLASFC